MENNNYHKAKEELMSRLKIMGTIALFWFLLFRIFTLWTDGVTNLDLVKDSITAATALYLPFRVGYRVTGTPTGGASKRECSRPSSNRVPAVSAHSRIRASQGKSSFGAPSDQ